MWEISNIAQISTFLYSLLLGVIFCVFYDLFKHQVMNDLKIYSDLLKSAGFYVSGETYDSNLKMNHMRITVVGKDGEVVYDSSADVSKMSNHKYRKEIKEALKKVDKALSISLEL